MKPMQYKIVRACWLHELERLVQETMRDGWVPQGGPFKTGYSDVALGQAMIKTVESGEASDG